MVRSSRSTAVVSMLLGGVCVSPAGASFTRFLQCVEGCLHPPRGYWREVACILDCELELAGCVVTLGGTLAYAPNPDPTCLTRIVGDGSLPGDRFLAGAPINFTLDLLRVQDGFHFGPSLGIDDEAGYNAFRSDNLYLGSSQIVSGSIRALSLADAALLADDPTSAASDGLWGSASVLYQGDFSSNLVMDTSGLGAGTWVLLTTVQDAQLGEQFGFSAIVLLPGPGTSALLVLSLPVVARRRRG